MISFTILRSTTHLSSFFVGCLCLLLMSGCLVDFNSDDKIDGSGPLETEVFEVDGFSRVSMSIPGDLIVTQGDTESLSIDAQANLHPYIDVSVVGDRLRIETEEDVSLDPSRTITVNLSVIDLKELDFAGAGLVSIDTLTTTSLSINFAGSGDIEINQLDATLLEMILGRQRRCFYCWIHRRTGDFYCW